MDLIAGWSGTTGVGGTVRKRGPDSSNTLFVILLIRVSLHGRTKTQAYGIPIGRDSARFFAPSQLVS
jgi:hypothetical protein